MANFMLAACRVSALAVVLWGARAVAAEDYPKPPGNPAAGNPAAGDPAAIARGRQVFSVNCGFCHGSDARGGEGGPNLLRSPIVLNDRNGELISAIVLNGRTDKGMPKFNLPMANIADIAAYVHSVGAGSAPPKPFDPKSVLVGNPAAGKRYFNGAGHCNSCHSVAKDLAGIGSKFGPRELNDVIFTGGATGMLGIPSPTALPRTAKVTMPSGEITEGRLLSLDDFDVVLMDAGNRRTIRRDGNVPAIEITDPMKIHFDMSRQWEDRDLHDVTAYLATLK